MESARDGDLERIHIDSDNEFKTIADAYNEDVYKRQPAADQHHGSDEGP